MSVTIPEGIFILATSCSYTVNPIFSLSFFMFLECLINAEIIISTQTSKSHNYNYILYVMNIGAGSSPVGPARAEPLFR